MLFNCDHISLKIPESYRKIEKKSNISIKCMRNCIITKNKMFVIIQKKNIFLHK